MKTFRNGVQKLYYAFTSVRAFTAFKGITSDRIEGNKAHEPL